MPQKSIREIFSSQQANRWNISQSSAAERIKKLKRLKAAIETNREKITSAIHGDFRKNPFEMELTEIFPVLEEINFAIHHLEGWMKPQKMKSPLVLGGARSEIRYEAKGVVLVMAPWNYPFNLSITPLVAAIAAGCCVMLRLSSKVARTAAATTEIIRSVFDENEVVVVEGGTDVADQLLEFPFDHIFFTGSPNIGKKIMQMASKHLTPVTLELGGKSPAIVDKSTKVEQAARAVVWGRFVNGGQTCVAPDYVFVHQSILPEFLEQVKNALGHFYGASEEGRRKSPDFARIIDERSFHRLKDALDQSVAQGAKVEIGAVTDLAERYFSPTVLSAVKADHPIMKDEIFGPILPVMTFKDVAEVTHFVQSRPKPLALYLFSHDKKFQEAILAGTSSGSAVINGVLLQMANPNIPFGGVGESGMGNYHGFFGFKTFSHERSVVIQKGLSWIQFFFPPYSGKAKKLSEKVLKKLS